MSGFGLGFSHQEINRKCQTVVRLQEKKKGDSIDGDKNIGKKAKFKKMGMNVMKKINAVKKMEEVPEVQPMKRPSNTIVVFGGNII